MKRILVGLLLASLLVLPLALRAEPGGGAEEKMRRVEELMRRLQEIERGRAGPEFSFDPDDTRVLEVHDVADLCVRLTDFVAANQDIRPAGAEVDEAQPLFGRAQEGEVFFSGVEDLIDLIVSNVRPGAWESEGDSICPSGESSLVVVAGPDVQAEVARYLDSLRMSAGRLVTVSVRVIARDAAGAPLPSGAMLSREEGLALVTRAEKGDGCRLAWSTRVTGYSGQRVALHRGVQQTYLQDYDVEVAQTAQISDPIVNILQTGLAFDVRPVAGDGTVVLTLRAFLASAGEPLRTVETTSGPVQAPEQARAWFSTTVSLDEGAFALIARGTGTGEWALLVSASTERVESPAKGGGR